MDATVQLIEDLTDLALGRKTELPILVAVADHSAVRHHLQSAVENSLVDSMPTPPGRSRTSKRILLKSGRFVLTRQRAVNQGLIGVAHGLLDEIDALNAKVEQERRKVAAVTSGMEAKLLAGSKVQHVRVDEVRSGAAARIDEVRAHVTSQVEHLSGSLAHLVGELRDELAQLRDRTDGLEAWLKTAMGEGGLVTRDQHEATERQVAELLGEIRLERHRRDVLERELRALRAEVVNHRPGDTGVQRAQSTDL
jgi:hypothetical protein